MSSSDASFDSSSDSETAETEVEYDLEVEIMSNTSEQKDTSDDNEPEDVYANEPLADENWLAQYTCPCHQSRGKELSEGICPFSCLACCCIRKQRIYLAFSFFLPKQSLSQTRKRSMAWNDVTNCAIPRLL